MSGGTKRTYGTGSLRQLGPDRWLAQVRGGWDPRTKKYRRIRRVIRGTKREAERRAREIAGGFAEEPADRSHPTFEEVAREYLARQRVRGCKESTLCEYERDVRRHYLPRLGSLQVTEIRPSHIEGLVSGWSEAGLAKYTVHRLYKQLRAILAWAERMEWIDRNPAARVDAPGRGEPRQRALTAIETRRLLEAARGTSLYPLLYLAAESGARQGELLALQWGDVSWSAGTINIERSVRQLADGRRIVTEPKTRQSRRCVFVSPEALAVLEKHKEAAEERWGQAGWGDDELVFPSSERTYLDPSNLRRAFQAVLRSVGLQDVRFHDLRHTAASLMEQSGVPISAVAAQLGHSNAAFTYSTYVHAAAESRASVAAAMGRLLDAQTGTATASPDERNDS